MWLLNAFFIARGENRWKLEMATIGRGGGKGGRDEDRAKSSVHLNYVRLLRVLADFVIRFSLELAHNYG